MNQTHSQTSDLSPQSSPPLASPHSWLITGGCGFIGTSLIKCLLEENPNAKIRVLDNLSVGTRDDLATVCEFEEIDSSLGGSATIELVIGDIRDAEFTLKVSKGIDVIVHLAANTGVGPSVDDPRADMEANVIGTFNMLEAARQNKVKRFVFASSGAPVGECEPPIHEELAPHPVSPYGASKLAGEGYCSSFYRTFEIQTIALRFGNVYGPGSGHKNSVVAKFIKQSMDGKTCEINGDGSQTRDFIFIDDLVDAIIKASLGNQVGETFQIATNKEHTINEVAEDLKKHLQQRGINMKIKYGQSRLGDVIRNFSDTSKAEKLLGWKAKMELEKGIEQTVGWFLSKTN